MNRAIPYALAVVALLVSHTAAFFTGATLRETSLARAQWEAEDRAQDERDSLRTVLRMAQAQTDTVTRVVTRRIRDVDTAFVAIPESVFVNTPAVADARAACMALSASCAEAQRAFQLERRAADARHRADSARVVLAVQRLRTAEQERQQEQDRKWRRRLEGAFGAVVIGVGVDQIRRQR